VTRYSTGSADVLTLPAGALPGGTRRSFTLPSGWPRWMAGLCGLLVLLAIWWTITDLLAAQSSLAHRFSLITAIGSLPSLWQNGLLLHVAVSLKRVLVGLLVALLAGVPLGLAIGSLRWLEAGASPSLQLLRMVSPLSWMPLAVMLFGVGDLPIYILLALAAVWPIMLNTAAGVKQLDPAWLQLARSLAATRRETVLRIVLPGILGNVLTGLRLAIGISWIVLVPCEMLGVSAGLGYMILDTRDRLAYGELMALVLLIGVLGFALDAAAQGLSRLLLPGARNNG